VIHYNLFWDNSTGPYLYVSGKILDQDQEHETQICIKIQASNEINIFL
jgi:hypothetical protein